MEEGACLIMVLAEIFRDGCCCSVSLLKFFGVGSAIKGSAVGGGVIEDLIRLELKEAGL